MIKINTSVFKFQVIYMTHPMLEKLNTHREQVINMFSPAFQVKTTKYIKELLKDICISDLIDDALS